jgi:hypothetical protein
VHKNLTWRRAKPLDNDELVNKFENEFAVKLPETFKIFIVDHNKAKPVPNLFNTEKSKGNVFNSLFSFNESDENNMFNNLRILKESGFPQHLVPFARDPFGNYLCFDANNDDTVVFWVHETDEIELVAESFDVFLDMLYE